jgi:hypothetical protein
MWFFLSNRSKLVKKSVICNDFDVSRQYAAHKFTKAPINGFAHERFEFTVSVLLSAAHFRNHLNMIVFY